MTNKELIAKCKEYDELTKEIKAKELRQKEIQAELKKELERKKVMSLTLTFSISATRLQRAEHFSTQRHSLKSILNFSPSSQQKESQAQDFYSDM